MNTQNSCSPPESGWLLAASITRSASWQTYFTIRYLVDRERVEDAYRAYAYFRWVDDTLDAESTTVPESRAFVQRQQSLIEACDRGGLPQAANAQENMLVDLVRRDTDRSGRLRSYIHNMMSVMSFDARRRGSLICADELAHYTHQLAVAVTEAMHYFIGHDCYSPRDETRYLAVSAAHITHMLRDTVDDVSTGYFNIPREYLDDQRIKPWDVDSEPYRRWVQQRVRLARRYFETGRVYLARAASFRCRLAGLAYTARFERVLDTIERDQYRLRNRYLERRSFSSSLQMALSVLSMAFDTAHKDGPPRVLELTPKADETLESGSLLSKLPGPAVRLPRHVER